MRHKSVEGFGSEPIKMMFIHDPLNLDTIRLSGGEDTPVSASPDVHDRSCDFQPGDVHKTIYDRDPLNLNVLDDGQLPCRKRRRRKRRYSTGDQNELTKMLSSPLKLKERSEKLTVKSTATDETKSAKNDCSLCVQSASQTKNLRYRFGNFVKITDGHHINEILVYFEREWFFNRDILDIGCNNGKITMEILKRFNPNTITGVDIDHKLISLARASIRQLSNSNRFARVKRYPLSFGLSLGSIVTPDAVERRRHLEKIRFFIENYVPLEGATESEILPKYDTIMCLNLTMWVHLNFGDSGVKRMFGRIYRELRPGGRLIILPQAFSSYKRKKNISVNIRANFDRIQLQPNNFVRYLLSSEVGFARSECLGYVSRRGPGSRRPLYMLIKS